MCFIPTVIPDCGEVSSEGSSSSPTPPPPKRRKPPAKQPPATGKDGRGKHRYRHRGRKGKRKGKGKRKYVTSSSSASSPSHDSTDSESPDSHHVASKKRRKVKRAHHSKEVGNTSSQEDKQSALYGTYRRHSSKLVDIASTCLSTITSKLFARNLISEAVQGQVISGQGTDHEKAVKVLYAVQQQIKDDPWKLRTLVEVLKEEPVFDGLTKEITSECNCNPETPYLTYKDCKPLEPSRGVVYAYIRKFHLGHSVPFRVMGMMP